MAELARRRRELGLTQGALARRIHISLSAVSWRETGRRSPGLLELDAHARALGLRLTLTPLDSPDERNTTT